MLVQYVILVFEKMKQEGCEFKASLSYIAFLVLKEKKIHPTILKQFLL
jgi:hypothetical protein